MTSLRVTDGGVKMRDDAIVKNKSYQRHPIGLQAKHWLEVLSWEDHAENTLIAYETVGAYLALAFPHYRGIEQFADDKTTGIADLRWFLEREWGTAAAATRRARLSALKSLFLWAVEDGIIHEDANPAEKIKPPKRRGGNRRSAHPAGVVFGLVNAQEEIRDRICLQLLGRLGLRKNELRTLRIRDIRLDTSEIRVVGKGDKPRIIPFGTLGSLRREIEFYLLTGERQPSEYLLHPKADRSRPMDASSVHRWFARCLQNAGLGHMPIHELRHSAADHFHRATGDLVAVQLLLGHESVGTTQTYLHPTTDDLATKLAAVEAAWQEQLSEQVVRS